MPQRFCALFSPPSHARLSRFAWIFAFLLLISAGTISSLKAESEGYPYPNMNPYADYYVSWNDGNDNNPGTFSLPFKTPSRAVDALHALPDPSGKIVLIRGGHYWLKESDKNRL
ncbi:MAG: hypothetical protein KJ645_11740, partial [Planctomycetes bacterium]|nr:hypothetical protein [Planctomycetota bacterium]